MSYIATFDRIGRQRVVKPLEINETDPDRVATKIHLYARRFLMSSEIEVTVDLDTRLGQILVGGFRPVGKIQLTPMSPAPAQTEPAQDDRRGE